MGKRAVILLAPGYEELEAVAVVDILRRAGIDALLAGLTSDPVPSARNVRIIPDCTIEQASAEEFDLIVLPGGLDGTERLKKEPLVREMLKKQLDQGRYVGAICAAPTILDEHGFSAGSTITCHPVCQQVLKRSTLSQERVVRDGQIITSQGPGTALEFALKLVEVLEGRAKMEEVNRGVLARI